MSAYTTTVGIEVHAELKTKSKMFCGCPNSPHDAEPNTNICPVCTAQPGALPVVNKQAIENVLLVGSAIGGELFTYSEFDRKNYFYPDIPKAYQISQYDYPFVSGGELAGVQITRIHLEEDTARSQHSEAGSLVDFNRAGVPLMELVTEPVIHDAKTAGDFGRELQLLLRTLGVSDANMERGEMRVEANISVSKTETLGTKVEVKNLNSFRAMEEAIAFETARHREVLDSGGEIIQETRGWDEAKKQTFSQRKKEGADDYRYFPDPDITKFDRAQVPDFEISRLNEKLPKLATKIREEYKNLGLKDDDIEILLQTAVVRKFFESVLEALADSQKSAALAANYTLSDLTALEGDFDFENSTPEHAQVFAELIDLVHSKEVTSRVAKDLLPEVMQNQVSPKQLAAERGLLVKNDSGEIKALAQAVIDANPDAVADYKAGAEKALKFLLGQGMKESRGSADPALLESALTDLL